MLLLRDAAHRTVLRIALNGNLNFIPSHTLSKAAADCGKPELFVETAPRTMSKVLGQHGCNRKMLAEQGVTLRVQENAAVSPGTLLANGKCCGVYGNVSEK